MLRSRQSGSMCGLASETLDFSASNSEARALCWLQLCIRSLMRRITAHWTRLALADAPSARSSHRLSAIEGRGYLFGGEAIARQSIDSTVHCLDTTAGTWTRPAPANGGASAVPQPRIGHAQAALNGKLVVFGGRTGVEMGEAALDDLWQWDPRSALWEPVRPPWPTHSSRPRTTLRP